MANKLTDIKVNEVSIVDRAANKRTFLLAKSDDQPKTILKEATTFNQLISNREAKEEIQEAYWAFGDSAWSILDDPNITNKKDMLLQSLYEFASYLSSQDNEMDKNIKDGDNKTMTTSLKTQFNDLLKSVGLKKGDNTDEKQEKIYAKGIDLISAMAEDLEKGAIVESDLKKRFEIMVEDLQKEGIVSIEKSEPAETIPVEESDVLKAAMAKKDEEIENLRKRIEAVEIEKKKVEIAETAKSITKNIGCDIEKTTTVLQKAQSSLSESEYSELIGLIKTANDTLESAGIFKEAGSSRSDVMKASQEVEKRATEYMDEQRKAGNNVSMAVAKMKVCDQDPSLKKRWHEEQSKA